MNNRRNALLESHAALALVLLCLHLLTRQAGFLYGAIGLLAVALFCKPLAALIAGWWLKFAELLATVNTRLLLSVVYFLALTPLALLFRCFNRNPLLLRKDPAQSSYYSRHDHPYSAVDLEKMW